MIRSSRYLEQRVVTTAEIASARTIIELGAGTGGMTRAILRAMPRHATLLSIEINPQFHSLLQDIEDDRLISHLGNASELRTIMASYRLQAPCVVISGVPFSTLSPCQGHQILEAISSQLSPNGHFVAYQLSKKIATMCHPFMGQGQSTMEYRNLPPMRIYCWKKSA